LPLAYQTSLGHAHRVDGPPTRERNSTTFGAAKKPVNSVDGVIVRVMASATGTCGAIGAPAGGAAGLLSSLPSRAATAIPPTAAMTLATKMILIFLCMEVTFFITGLRSIRSGSHMFLKASPYNHVKVKPFSMTMTSMGLDYKLWNLPASR
tara:strand:- start:13390 stop:13842 length:453 start_codon:yes stop_codon:yes gene_type:complete